MSTESAIRVRIAKVAEEHATLGFFQNALNAKGIADVVDLTFEEADGPADAMGRRWRIADITLLPRDTEKGRRLRTQINDDRVGFYRFHYSHATPWFYWLMEPTTAEGETFLAMSRRPTRPDALSVGPQGMLEDQRPRLVAPPGVG